jgi:hypothetical protein
MPTKLSFQMLFSTEGKMPMLTLLATLAQSYRIRKLLLISFSVLYIFPYPAQAGNPCTGLPFL